MIYYILKMIPSKMLTHQNILP